LDRPKSNSLVKCMTWWACICESLKLIRSFNTTSKKKTEKSSYNASNCWLYPEKTQKATFPLLQSGCSCIIILIAARKPVINFPQKVHHWNIPRRMNVYYLLLVRKKRESSDLRKPFAPHSNLRKWCVWRCIKNLFKSQSLIDSRIDR